MNRRFIILTVVISVSGFTQGLLLPLLSVILEKQGVSSSFNGLSSSALYLGMLFASPFMEGPVRRYGFKSIIIFGLILITFSILLFPIWMNLYVWVVLRFLVGIGDTALHFATQVWITSTVEKSKRGKSISLYGLSYGLGFGIGPLGLILLPYGIYLPFTIALILLSIILIAVLSLKNEKPKQIEKEFDKKRYLKVYKYAGLALLPMFIYGLLEATLNTSFPIYGIRVGMTEAIVSMLLSFFVVGSLIFQLPLGMISDYLGRRKVLFLTTLFGGILFALIPQLHTYSSLFIIFILAGGLVGSIYSLGLAYVADLVPIELLPTANIIAGIHFGIGSIIGPYLGGTVISHVSPDSLFYFIAIAVLAFVFFSTLENVLNRKGKATEEILQ